MSSAHPTVVVDIDGVLLDTISGSVAAFNRQHGTNYTPEDIFNFDAEHNKGKFVIDGVDYFHKHQLDHDSHEVIDGVVDALKQVKARGYRIIALTARSEEMFGEATKAAICRYFGIGEGENDLLHSVHYSKPKGSSDRRDKGEIARELGGDILIDDAVRHCINARNHGLHAILLQYKYNQVGHDWPKVYTAKNWPDAVRIVLEIKQNPAPAQPK